MLTQSTFPKDKILQRPPSLWRYAEALPTIAEMHKVSFQEGFTPLVPYLIGAQTVWLKMDFLFPTGSYKDRGATILMSQAKQEGISFVVQDSSGNAGCAIACYAGKAQIGCKIFVPADTSPAKILQIEMYGAEIVKVQGDREATAQACLEEAKTQYYASHVYNDAFLEGTKTFAFEVWEQLGWQVPDSVVLPAGNGTLLLGVYKGFSELLQAGEIAKTPKIIGIQAGNCAPLYHQFWQRPSPTWQSTLAEGIAIAQPYRAQEMIDAIQKTGGTFLIVNEQSIQSELFTLAKQGFYVEPTSACVVAGLKQYAQSLTLPEKIVSVLTGSGLKATEKILKLK
jgi:threonine synthase